jgi:hypothetical protein
MILLTLCLPRAGFIGVYHYPYLKLDLVVHTYNPSYWRDRGRKIKNLGQPSKVRETLSKNKIQTKGLGI